MSNSEQNKNWKQELEQIELHSSDLSFEKAAAWDKLYDRLEKPESKKRVGWFKWAAVFITISSLLTYYFFSKPTSRSSEQPTIVNESKTNESIQNQLATEPNISTETVIEKKESTVTKETEPNAKKSKELKFVQVSNTEIANIRSAKIDIPNIISIAAPVADTLRNITIAVAPEKKKLRVIHINDYAVPVKPDIFMADNTRPGARNLIRLNTIPATNESSTETLPLQTSPSIKIKLSPQN